MTKTYITISSIIVLLTLVLFSACSNTSPRYCSSSDFTGGYFCHQGYNFGKDKSSAFKSGVRDGCRTGNGYFVKKYALSRRSIDYVNGWDAGRTRCRHIVPTAAKSGMRTQYQQAIDQRRYYGN